jgi:hypothetical protein
MLPSDPGGYKNLLSRKEAIALGSNRYFTGKSCPKGHIAEREVRPRGCVECRLLKDRQRYNKNPIKERERALYAGWKRNGYPTPTRLRPKLCEACGGPPTKRCLHLDHDHKSGKFRGWLCHHCNIALGLVENKERIAMLQKYLELYATE